MSGGNVDGGGGFVVTESKTYCEDINLANADINHQDLYDGVEIPIGECNSIRMERVGGFNVNPAGFGITGGNSTVTLRFFFKLPTTFSFTGSSLNGGERIILDTPGFELDLSVAGFYNANNNSIANGNSNLSEMVAYRDVTEVQVRITRVATIGSSFRLDSIVSSVKAQVQCLENIDGDEFLYLVCGKNDFRDITDSGLPAGLAGLECKPCVTEQGLESSVESLYGELEDGTSYRVTNIDSATTVFASAGGDVRWENGSTIRIVTSRPTKLFLRPTSSGEAAIANPLVWSHSNANPPPSTNGGVFSALFASEIEYTPGTVDLQLDINETRAWAGLPNGSAPAASDDWGLITATGTVFEIRGRDAEAMNISLQSMVEVDLCQQVKQLQNAPEPYCPTITILGNTLEQASSVVNQAISATISGFALDQIESITAALSTDSNVVAQVSNIVSTFDNLTFDINFPQGGDYIISMSGICETITFTAVAAAISVIVPGSAAAAWINIQSAVVAQGEIAMVAGNGNGWNRGGRIDVAAPPASRKILKFTIGNPSADAFGHIGIVANDSSGASHYSFAFQGTSGSVSIYFSNGNASLYWGGGNVLGLGAYAVGDQFEIEVPSTANPVADPIVVRRNGTQIGSYSGNPYQQAGYIAVCAFRNSNFEDIELCHL